MWQVELLADANSPTYSSATMSLFDLGKQLLDAARDVQLGLAVARTGAAMTGK